jgi:hypothetical protein
MLGRFLKWHNHIVGTIGDGLEVSFTDPGYHPVVSFYAGQTGVWNADMFSQFLQGRIFSRERRDREKLLWRLGLKDYDIYRIADITRAINPKDLLWIARDEAEEFENTITSVFHSVFNLNVDLQGGSIDSPEGQNIKRYGVYNGRYGIFKKRLTPLSTDAESELAVYKLSMALGVDCCPVYFTDNDAIFSVFEYDFSKEYIVHFRNILDEGRSKNEYENLIAARPQYEEKIIKMLLLDFITRQDDRHLSNIAVKISENGAEEFYPLYDNGRSLFYEDTKETVEKAAKDVKSYSTAFGPSGTYWDHLCDIAGSHGVRGKRLSQYINCDLGKDKTAEILREARFSDYRLEGSVEWISNCLEEIKRLY